MPIKGLSKLIIKEKASIPKKINKNKIKFKKPIRFYFSIKIHFNNYSQSFPLEKKI